MLQVARSIRGALLAALLLPVHASAASPPLADLALEDAIAVLQAGGLRVFYSTDLV